MRLPVLAATLLLAATAPLSAQEPVSSAPDPVLRGRVVDATTGTPLLGAWIGPAGANWGTYSKEDGGFWLPKVSAGQLVYEIEMLGYARRLIELAPDEPVFIELAPDPIVLEGVRVVADRFKRRRNAVATSVRTIDRDELIQWAGTDLLQFVRGRAGISLTPCPTGSFTSFASLDCALVRGRRTEIKVCLDEAPLLGGADMLRLYAPEELYMIEVYGRGSQIRVYTEQFMRRAATRRINVPPLGFGFC